MIDKISILVFYTLFILIIWIFISKRIQFLYQRHLEKTNWECRDSLKNDYSKLKKITIISLLVLYITSIIIFIILF